MAEGEARSGQGRGGDWLVEAGLGMGMILMLLSYILGQMRRAERQKRKFGFYA